MNSRITGSESSAARPAEDIASRIRQVSEENERLFSRLLEGEQHFRQLAKAVWRVQEEERRRLALELHDGLGQTLTALKNFLQQQRAHCDDADMQSGLDAAFALAETALQDTRELSRLLRPPVLDDLGLEAALQWLARIQRERAGLNVQVDWQLDVERLDTQLETLVFRAAQEALTNVARHAQATTARVEVCKQGDSLDVLIEDDGEGFDVEAALGTATGDGFGLRGVRDRAELFGGHVDVKSVMKQGTRIRIRLPYQEQAGDTS